MRLLKLQVGNAFDGRKLEPQSGGPPLDRPRQLARRVRLLDGRRGLRRDPAVDLVGRPARDDDHQPDEAGPPRRFANSAVVLPVGGGNGIALACLLILGLRVLLVVVAVLAVLFLGGQVSSILSAVGTSFEP